MKGGYIGKILRINLTERKIEIQELNEEMCRNYIGGSGIAAKILYEETSSNTLPLGEDNLLIFMTGPLTGTGIPCTGRHSVVSKSPLTGIWGESSVGGFWGKELKKAGYDGIVIIGKSEQPVYLWIYNGKVEIRNASHLWGKDTYQVNEIIKRETDPKAIISSIGIAGEKQIRVAGIFNEGKDSRAAARCGLGAVAGSKKLKAVAVRGTNKINIYQKEKLRASLGNIFNVIADNTKIMKDFGTANAVVASEEIGDLPIKNWKEGKWKEGAKKISGQQMAHTILNGTYSCFSCPIGCGRKVKIEKGPYSEVNGAGPEYETIGMLGSSCLVDNLEAIAKANELCNRYGIDTIEVGGSIAFAMELFEAGLISKKDAGNIDLRWGEPNVLIELVHQIGNGVSLGKLLGEGIRAASEKIGGFANECAIHTKGLGFPAHDPRAYHSQALGYATSNRGACHLQSFSHAFENGLSLPELGYPETLNRFEDKGKAVLVAKCQDLMCIFDSLAMCKFILFGGIKIQQLVDWLNLVTGMDINLKELMEVGERIFNLKRIYSTSYCGVSRKDDTLPSRILTYKRGLDDASLPHFGEMLSEYYQYRRWNEYGIPIINR